MNWAINIQTWLKIVINRFNSNVKYVKIKCLNDSLNVCVIGLEFVINKEWLGKFTDANCCVVILRPGLGVTANVSSFYPCNQISWSTIH